MKIDLFEEMKKYGVEQLVINYDEATGLKSIIAINDTTMGPAIGGCRMKEYDSVDDAIVDAIRLSEGMKYKNALANTGYGGGKTVIIGDSKEKTPLQFRAFGRFVETLNGRYYSGPDVGTTGEDIVHALSESKYFIGLPEEYGGGDTSLPTAYGVLVGMKASANKVYGDDSLEGLTVVVQGVGKVGQNLVDLLIEEGAKVKITDIGGDKVEALVKKYPQIEVVKSENIYKEECDIFSPCALGGILNDDTIPELKCKIISGSANNQLLELEHGQMLHDRDILFAPDFVVNSGGLLQAVDELERDDVNKDRVMAKVEHIYDVVSEIFEISEREDIPTYQAAIDLGQDYIDTVGAIKRKYINK